MLIDAYAWKYFNNPKAEDYVDEDFEASVERLLRDEGDWENVT